MGHRPRSMNSSWIFASTTSRFTLMQICPRYRDLSNLDVQVGVVEDDRQRVPGQVEGHPLEERGPGGLL